MTRHCVSLNRFHPSSAPVLTIFAIFAASDTLDFTTRTTIATALVNSLLNYCNSLYHGLHINQIKLLQHIQNGLALAVIRTPKHFHISPVLQSLHWLKVNQRIQYKIISITHNLHHLTKPKYLHRLINIKPPSRTRSSDQLCISLPFVSTRLMFAGRSFSISTPAYGTLYQ